MSKRKSQLTAIIIIVILTATTILASTYIMSPKAQFRGVGPAGGVSGPIPAGVTPDIQVQTWALLSVRPTTIGLGQPVLVNLETQPAPGTERLNKDYTVVITKPDGTTETRVIESYPDDGTMWFEYTPDQLGQYKLIFKFLGTYFPAGRYLDGVGPPAANITTGGSLYTESVYFKPYTTPERTFNVTTQLAASWPLSPLPSDYWTRPAPYERREWWPILGNWPWRGPAGGDFEIPLDVFNQYYPDTNRYQPGHDSRGLWAPWTQGPESAHVVWKRELTQAGILGGDYGVEDTNAGVFGGMGIGGDPSTYGFAPIAYAGSAYQLITKNAKVMINGTIYDSPTNVWTRYDVRTGEVIWENTAMANQAPSVIEYNIGAIPSGGGFPTHVTEVNFLYIGGGRLVKYRASTGLVNTNVSIAPLTTGTYYQNGYCLSVQDLGAGAANATGGRYRLINWTTLGTSASLATRVISNISWPLSSVPNTIDYNVNIAASVVNWQRAGVYYGINVTGISLATGNILWTQTIYDAQYSGSTDIADHGKIATLTLNQGFFAFDLATGKLAWQSEPMDYPWDAAGFGGYSVQSAYGLLYRQAYSGIYAFDWDTGKRVWKYEALSDPYETPYVNEAGEPTYSWNIGANIADGKMYAYNTEHSATVPITRGWQFHCINATTGEGIWKVAIPGAASKHTPDVGPIHDGYVQLFSSDGFFYWFGKGKSATTVTAPDTAVPLGTSLLIKGTVLDLSPAQPNTPCVSVDSVAAMMEHVHIQRDLPNNLTGVPVTLTAIGSDGSVTAIGETTTNAYYGTFNMPWTPSKQDTYQIIASFGGDASYGSSAAATAVTVGPAPGTPESVEIPEAIDYSMLIIGMGIAIIIVIAIVGVILYLKKK